jgi:hypothetical protein
MNAALIAIGLVLLLAGRRLYWVFVGAAGFIIGAELSTLFLAGQPEALLVVIALLAGIVFAMLAFFFQRLAVIIVGFLSGGYLGAYLLPMLNINLGSINWVVVLVCAIIGAMLMTLLFDWALMVLSSLIGALLLVQAVNFTAWLQIIILLALTILGLLVQAQSLSSPVISRRR